MWHTSGMPKRIDFALSETELSIIEKALQRSESPPLVKQATAVRLLHQGYSPDGVQSPERMRLTRVRYLDYTATPHWRAIRKIETLPPGSMAGTG